MGMSADREAAIREARDILQATQYAKGYDAVDALRAQVASLMAELAAACEREQTLREALRKIAAMGDDTYNEWDAIAAPPSTPAGSRSEAASLDPRIRKDGKCCRLQEDTACRRRHPPGSLLLFQVLP